MSQIPFSVTPGSATTAPQLGIALNTMFSELYGNTGTGTSVFSVLDPQYGGGADPTGGRDSSAAFQATFNAAAAVGGTVRIPAGTYTINTTISITGYVSFFMNVWGDTYKTQLTWTGAPSSSMFLMRGWRSSDIVGVTAITNNTVNLTVWDIDVNATSTSSNFLTFRNCKVAFGTGGTCYGWRGGISTTGAGDISFITFINCTCSGQNAAGDIGWLVLRNNALNWVWLDGAGLTMDTVFSNRRPGGGESGGDSMFWYGFGTAASSLIDFDFGKSGSYSIFGGRFESGKRFSYQGAGGAHYYTNLAIVGAKIINYSPADGILFKTQSSAILGITNCSVGNTAGQPDYTNQMITIANADTTFTQVNVKNSVVQAAEPFWNVSGTVGTWRVRIEGSQRRNMADDTVSGLFQDILSAYPAGNTGATPAPALGNGEVQSWTLSASTTWGAPTGPVQVGQRLTLLVTSSGAFTTAWNATYRNAPAVAVAANGQKATFNFMWDGSNWQYIGGSTAFA
jgi:hypothetical protein